MRRSRPGWQRGPATKVVNAGDAGPTNPKFGRHPVGWSPLAHRNNVRRWCGTRSPSAGEVRGKVGEPKLYGKVQWLRHDRHGLSPGFGSAQ